MTTNRKPGSFGTARILVLALLLLSMTGCSSEKKAAVPRVDSREPTSTVSTGRPTSENAAPPRATTTTSPAPRERELLWSIGDRLPYGNVRMSVLDEGVLVDVQAGELANRGPDNRYLETPVPSDLGRSFFLLDKRNGTTIGRIDRPDADTDEPGVLASDAPLAAELVEREVPANGLEAKRVVRSVIVYNLMEQKKTATFTIPDTDRYIDLVAINANVVVMNEHFGYSGTYTGISTDTGRKLWQIDYFDTTGPASPVAPDGSKLVLLTGGFDDPHGGPRRHTIIDINSGSVITNAELDGYSTAYVQWLGPDTLHYNDGGRQVVYRFSGSEALASFEVPGYLTTSTNDIRSAIADEAGGYVVFNLDNGGGMSDATAGIRTYSLESGQELWRVPVEEGRRASLAGIRSGIVIASVVDTAPGAHTDQTVVLNLVDGTAMEIIDQTLVYCLRDAFVEDTYIAEHGGVGGLDTDAHLISAFHNTAAPLGITTVGDLLVYSP